MDEDPFDEASDKYCGGKEMVERIREIESDRPDLARKLKEVVRSSIFDWRSVVDATDFAGQLSPVESRALRLALENAVKRQDENLIERLYEKGAPFSTTLHGTTGILPFAMTIQAFGIVDRLLDWNVDAGSSPVIHAAGCSDELLLRLVEFGVRFDEEAIYSAAETGALDGAIALVQSGHLVEPKTKAQIVASAVERAARHDQDAVRVESGELSSYLTADQYRGHAKSLRLFANRLRD